MTDFDDGAAQLLEAIDRRDVAALEAVYAPDSVLVTVTPNTRKVAHGPEAIAALLGEWYASWEEDPGFSWLEVLSHGQRAMVEFERVSTFEGEPWVVCQAHALEWDDDGIRVHRIFCTGPRAGEPHVAVPAAEARR